MLLELGPSHKTGVILQSYYFFLGRKFGDPLWISLNAAQRAQLQGQRHNTEIYLDSLFSICKLCFFRHYSNIYMRAIDSIQPELGKVLMPLRELSCCRPSQHEQRNSICEPSQTILSFTFKSLNHFSLHCTFEM